MASWDRGLSAIRDTLTPAEPQVVTQYVTDQAAVIPIRSCEVQHQSSSWQTANKTACDSTGV